MVHVLVIAPSPCKGEGVYDLTTHSDGVRVTFMPMMLKTLPQLRMLQYLPALSLAGRGRNDAHRARDATTRFSRYRRST